MAKFTSPTGEVIEVHQEDGRGALIALGWTTDEPEKKPTTRRRSTKPDTDEE
ncbi:hypothetical protein GS982_02215 [Rhodococcus hoagii]|uniref:Uncharacterized protein n=1 Tax=Rhodococcus hoagii TaxID=43767 RepID=A0A9Q2P8S3_RHOHA|nr:hypothetical protein [Prescottella equi]MBM4509350.1 hypothetical protein [Prescottella equi]MBM4567663.1 hypothetical protein [Prescottella equi]MBM4595972.1 hypothetical protein [Prescottella equi]MBM4595983.1 hypothetical protein [Prescottella equi]MCU7531387.1 hypothetical protein [Prescottella equi]